MIKLATNMLLKISNINDNISDEQVIKQMKFQ